MKKQEVATEVYEIRSTLRNLTDSIQMTRQQRYELDVIISRLFKLIEKIKKETD